MNHRGHMLIGLIFGIAAMLVLQIFSPELVALVLLGSILPDIDLQQSKASKVVQFVAVIGGTFLLQPLFSKFFSTIAAAVAALLASIALVFLVLLPLRLKHRGVTHSIWAAVVFGVLAGLAVGIAGGIVALLAYASHIIVDKL